MRAEFSIVIARRANVVSVPLSALQGEASRRFVYVKDFDLANAFVKDGCHRW
jgi:cobalt-zinc-cadmium efflux system membrane fusion protein